MKRSDSQIPTLHFRGSPVALDSLVGIAHEDLGGSPKISLDQLKSGATPPGVRASQVGDGASRLRMTLAGSTPPGTYNGSAELGGKRYPVEVQVERYVHLSVSPRQLILEAHAGQKLQVDLTIANSGNVDCDIGKNHYFGLYDIHGAERAIGTAFRQAEGTAEKRLEGLLEELAVGHAGLVRVQVEQGEGAIALGEVRPLRLNLHMPAGLKAGCTYSGTLPLHNLRYYVKVRATDKR